LTQFIPPDQVTRSGEERPQQREWLLGHDLAGAIFPQLARVLV
jgi:hypothetical protein